MKSLRAFLLEFWHFDRCAILINLGLNLAGALLEGLSLMLLLPLLAVAGIFSGLEGGSVLPTSLAAGITRLLDGLATEQKLLAILALYISLIAVQSSVVLLRGRRSLQLQLRFVGHLRDTLFGGIAQARWRFLAQHHSSEFLSVLTADVGRIGLGTVFLMQLLTQFAVFPVYLGLAIALSPSITGLALVTGTALWWLLHDSRNDAEDNGRALSKTNRVLLNELQEFLGTLKLIKIHGEETGYQQQFSHVVERLNQQQLAFQFAQTRTQMVFRVGGATALAGLTYTALVWAELPVASLLVMVVIFARMLPQVSTVHMGLQQLWNMAPAFESWQDWVNRCRMERGMPDAHTTAITLTERLELSHVTYRHPQGGLTLEARDVCIPARCTTAIVGSSGSGKTTLVDLLSGLNEPLSGEIRVDGQPLRPNSDWRSRIAYIPQETSILDGTIRENLTWGAVTASDAQLISALEHAAAGDMLRGLPAGLDTRVGERGLSLSGGERQRLALARALLRKPELLILDEATGALDLEHQQIIIEALRLLHGRMTVLIVTHRYGEIRDLLDGFVTVEAGRIGNWLPMSVAP